MTKRQTCNLGRCTCVLVQLEDCFLLDGLGVGDLLVPAASEGGPVPYPVSSAEDPYTAIQALGYASYLAHLQLLPLRLVRRPTGLCWSPHFCILPHKLCLLRHSTCTSALLKHSLS